MLGADAGSVPATAPRAARARESAWRGGEGALAGRGGMSPAGPSVERRAGLLERYAERFKCAPCEPLALSQQAEQDVFAAGLVVAKLARLTSSHLDDFPGTLAESLEHAAAPSARPARADGRLTAGAGEDAETSLRSFSASASRSSRMRAAIPSCFSPASPSRMCSVPM